MTKKIPISQKKRSQQITAFLSFSVSITPVYHYQSTPLCAGKVLINATGVTGQTFMNKKMSLLQSTGELFKKKKKKKKGLNLAMENTKSQINHRLTKRLQTYSHRLTCLIQGISCTTLPPLLSKPNSQIHSVH